MMAVFANKGFLVTPYLIKEVEGRDISLYQRKSVPLPIKESTMENIRRGLRDVVSQPDGTASILSDLPVALAGKTGTAQVSRGQAHGWFVGFFPFKNPRFVICVFLENAGAGFVSSMLTEKIIQAMAEEQLI